MYIVFWLSVRLLPRNQTIELSHVAVASVIGRYGRERCANVKIYLKILHVCFLSENILVTSA